MNRRYPERPLVGVGALIIDDGRVLLARRGKEPLKGEWTLPGGLVETGETLVEAVQREALEETALTIEVGKVAGVFDRIYPDASGRVEYHYILVDYVCSVISGSAHAGSDIDEVRWFSPEELATLELPEFTKELILRHLQ
jgi:ADP-ribose pyrophosphatase YjhB (NUDIX family)